MLLNYQYRCYLETPQKAQLNNWLRVAQYWYNWQLGDRFTWWETNRSNYIVPSGDCCYLSCSLPPKELRDKPNFFSQKKLLPEKKKDLVLVRHSGELLDFTTVPSQTLQDVSKRVDQAFERYIKGDKNGKRSGKPRFKSRYRTLRIEGQAIKITRVGKDWLFLSCSKLKGWLKIRLHRPLPPGFLLKNILISKKADGWYCTFCLDEPTVPIFTPDKIIPTWENSLGIDAVLYEDDYLATSEGQKLPSVKSFRKNQHQLAKISRAKNSRKKGTKARRKLAKREGRKHQQIARARKDHAYKTAHTLVRTNKKVFLVEDLNLKGLTKRNKVKKDTDGNYLKNGQSAKSGLNKSWLDAAFGSFYETLSYIAEKAGAVVIKVNPAYTSQLLAYRDEFVFTDCSIRVYYDPREEITVDRDYNSSINIKRVGLELFPTINRRSGKITKSKTDSTTKQVLEVLKGCQKPILCQ
ncbi:RNA-guided endonuclease TnpB family protein [Gloeocapsa sp. PCC 73106]|uniref:RNA-guided endonuclease InsQ/TnpB family protein n=1 Tax=Gloeocapsa sp. PCC 73106 TaxID=102232 RepID=UPI0002AC745F|nr:RNA-guided endonuclease TnpB family protein [Gloeocapsa sp. PCC 73106]ELR98603.1 transposase, IS605 OrfB family, central region [Gloeocapsa sp. PCC 73106]